MITLEMVTGAPIPVSVLRTELHQPSIYEISLLGEEAFDFVTSIMKVSPEMFVDRIVNDIIKKTKKEEIKDFTDKDEEELRKEFSKTFSSYFDVFFQYLLVGDQKKDFLGFFYLIFPDVEKIDILEADKEMLFFLKDGSIVTVMEFQWEEIRKVILSVFSYGDKDENNEEFNPAGREAQRIVEKIKEARKKRNPQYEEEIEVGTVLGTMASILASLDKLSLNEVTKLTFSQLVIQLDRSQKLKEYDDIITSSVFAGVPDGVELPNWSETV